MIYRGNWLLVKEYMTYRLEVEQLSKSSSRTEECWFRYLLEWAADKPFENAPNLRPVFPEYMLTTRRDGRTIQLSPVYVRKAIRTAYRFFQWLITHKKGFSQTLTPVWLDTLKTPRMTIEYKEHEAVTISEIQVIAHAPVSNWREKRIRAAAVFLFLSGIRLGAFVTLPLLAVDIDNLTIKQWPKLGVQTKFKKHATTFLLSIPDLLEVVKEWDQTVRAVLPANGYWFTPLLGESGNLDVSGKEIGEFRNSGVRKDLKDWLQKVGLPYHSPHKFRHGHAVYGLKNAKDIQAFKAVSQNLMHSNISITDGVYGMLSDNDVRSQIGALGQQIANGNDNNIDQLIDLLITRLKND